MFALNLGDDGRILSATLEEYGAPGQPLVEELPAGDISEYRYVDGEYIHDPLPPEPKPPEEPSADELMDILLGVTG